MRCILLQYFAVAVRVASHGGEYAPSSPQIAIPDSKKTSSSSAPGAMSATPPLTPPSGRSGCLQHQRVIRGGIRTGVDMQFVWCLHRLRAGDRAAGGGGGELQSRKRGQTKWWDAVLSFPLRYPLSSLAPQQPKHTLAAPSHP